MHDRSMSLQEVRNEHMRSIESSPVIALGSDDEPAQQPSSASAPCKTRVLIVAQHVSVQPFSSQGPVGTVHLMKLPVDECSCCGRSVHSEQSAKTCCIATDALSACAGKHVPAGAAVHAGRCQRTAAEALWGLPADAPGHQAARQQQRKGQKCPCKWLYCRATSETPFWVDLHNRDSCAWDSTV